MTKTQIFRALPLAFLPLLPPFSPGALADLPSLDSAAGQELAAGVAEAIPLPPPDLVLRLHAFTRDLDSLEHVDSFFPGALLLPAEDLPFGTLSMARPMDVVASLVDEIDRAWEAKTRGGAAGFEHIVLVGHSMGALFARKVYVAACGEYAEARFEPELRASLQRLPGTRKDPIGELIQPRPWAAAVRRIILLAGINRGWSISHHMSLSRAVSMSFGVLVGNGLGRLRGRPPLILSIRRGAPFITQLRIQWLAMRRHARLGHRREGLAVTVQLLGTIDDLVSPEDNIDLVTGDDFIYLDVPRTGHKDVIELGDSSAVGKRRRLIFQQALEKLPEPHQADPANLAVTDVVFVIHGIRDQGFWTDRIARQVIDKAREEGRVVAAETSTYGYFPILSFLRPRARGQKVEWLMDRYTEALATYPNAKTFSYVGHSNGTYLLARALREYPSVNFDNVVFAGSVVRHNLDWKTFLDSGQVGKVLNFVASADWVVAFGPKTFELLGIQDLGGAGHDGFKAASTEANVIEPKCCIEGGHGAAIAEDFWDSIAHFVLTGEYQEPPGSTHVARRSPWVFWPAKIAPLLVLGLLVGLFWLGFRIWALPWPEWLRTLSEVAYLGLLWTILTRV